MNHITPHIAVQYNGLTFNGSTPKHINQYLIEENIMKIFYKTSATATGGRDGRTQVDDGSISFDLVSFQNDGTGADEKHQRAEYGKHRRTDEKRPHGVGEKLIHGLA